MLSSESGLVFLVAALGFRRLLFFFEEMQQPVDQFALSANDVQAALVLVIFQYFVQSAFDVVHVDSLRSGRSDPVVDLISTSTLTTMAMGRKSENPMREINEVDKWNFLLPMIRCRDVALQRLAASFVPLLRRSKAASLR
jgi:hypothetical protein